MTGWSPGRARGRRLGGVPVVSPAVPPVLAPYVDSLVCYDSDLGEPGVHIGMPSTSLTLVVPVAELLDVGWAGRPASRSRFRAGVAGLHTAPAEIHHQGRQRGVQVGLRPAGARALLGVPAAELVDEMVALEDVDAGLRHLPEQLAEVAHRRRATVVSEALTGALARHGGLGARAEVGRSLAGLTRGRRVAEVADDIGYSRRHLGDLVRAELGLSPQRYRRLARFERSHGLVVANARTGRPDLAGVAAVAGYADQAHLTRDWTELAGCSPTEWLRRELDGLDVPGAPGPEVVSAGL